MLTMYSKDNCPKCDQVVDYLTERNIEYKMVKIVAEVKDSEKEIDRMDFVQMYPSVRSAPFLVDEEGIVYRNLDEIRQSY